MQSPRLLLCLLLAGVTVQGQTLRVGTMNIWSGLTYRGVATIKSYEDADAQEQRVQRLIEGLRTEHPDVLALQEVNPVGALATRIADDLDYSCITQRVLSGIKVGPVGVPWNLNEGLAILARPELELEFVDVVPLNSTCGAFGDVISFHTTEQNAALIGSLCTPSGDRVIIANIHLPATPPDLPGTRKELARICDEMRLSDAETGEWLQALGEQNTLRSTMIDNLVGVLEQRFPGAPVLVCGDFNLPPESSDIARLSERAEYTDVSSVRADGPVVTWDGLSNPLTRFSADDPHGPTGRSPLTVLSSHLDKEATTLDYIFVRNPLTADRISDVSAMFNIPVNGQFASDHYGLVATIDMHQLRSTASETSAEIEWLPLFSYDTDVGFGYGLKTFFLNQVALRESFDIIVFNSTKGERWYRVVFSIPDFELRQGTVYPLALDITLDYDKYLKNVFFGVGSNSAFANKEEYTREPFEADVRLSRGFSRQTVGEAGLRYRWIRNSNIDTAGMIPMSGGPLSTGTATALSLGASFRHDTRNSFINPSRGIVLQAEAEYAPDVGNVSFYRGGATIQYYTTLMYPKTVLACRLSGQSLGGTTVPIQFLLPLGGNKTLRGYPQDRFLGKVTLVSNIELRFPIIWRFGAVAGIDAGNIWMSASDVSLNNWRSNSVVGLRFYMDTFIVRADLGFSSETTGFYLNFGHVF